MNDTLGHDIGDLLLQQVAVRLKQLIQAKGFVARMGGDEFTIIITTYAHLEELQALAEEMITVVHEPYQLAAHAVQITTSIGISLFPANGQDVQTLMKQADIAMYRAKKSGKNQYCFYPLSG